MALYDNILGSLREPPSWNPSQETILLEPYTYLTAHPGKEVRSLLIDAFNHWLHVPDDSLVTVKRIVGMLHTASLLMDDVEDASDLRRGIPVAHKIYGVPQTINSANYVYFLAYQELAKLSPSTTSTTQDLWSLVNEELLHLHRGQGMDLYWRDSLTCPTEEEYLAMVNNKTGGLFRIAVKLMMAMSPITSIPDYVPLACLIGVLFQIRDDYLNLQSSQYADNKGFCEDLTEGKFSFPIVHSIRADTSNRQMMNVLRQRPTDLATKEYAVSYMRQQTDSFTYTLDVLKRLDTVATREVDRLGDNEALMAILQRMRVEKSESLVPKPTSTSRPHDKQTTLAATLILEKAVFADELWRSVLHICSHIFEHTMFILGVNLPERKLIKIALTRFVGIGHHRANLICSRLSLHDRLAVGDMTDHQISRLSALLSNPTTHPPPLQPIDPFNSMTSPSSTLTSDLSIGQDPLQGLLLESDLRREVKANIAHHKAVGTYKGRRHSLGFPVRGQRTHTNAKTAKALNRIERKA